jgi:hypothetical protein
MTTSASRQRQRLWGITQRAALARNREVEGLSLAKIVDGICSQERARSRCIPLPEHGPRRCPPPVCFLAVDAAASPSRLPVCRASISRPECFFIKRRLLFCFSHRTASRSVKMWWDKPIWAAWRARSRQRCITQPRRRDRRYPGQDAEAGRHSCLDRETASCRRAGSK